jgi:integrase/recombinase XerD
VAAVSAEVVLAGELLDQGAELARLDAGDGHDWYAAWIIASAKTLDSIRSYRHVAEQWRDYLAASGLDLLDVERVHVDAYLHRMRTTPTRTGRPPAPATMAQRTAVLGSLYDYLVEVGACDRTPVPRGKRRDKAPAESTTVGMSQAEAIAFRARCREHEGVDDRGVLVTMLGAGLRVAEVIALDVGDVTIEEGETVIVVREGKGRKARKVVAGAEVVEAIDQAVQRRASELGLDDPGDVPLDTALFRTARGRFAPRSVARMVQRVARAAGVTSWARLSPHSLRHTFATLSLDAGVPIDVVQDALGHAHTSTTRRYDLARGKVRRVATAAHTLDAYLAAA